MTQPRFLFVPAGLGGRPGPRPAHRHSAAGEAAPADWSVAWRLVGANNRELGRACRTYEDLRACRDAVIRLQQGLDRAEPRVAASEVTGAWSWRLNLDGAAVATSGRSYRRQRECQYNLTHFLAAVPTAQLAQGMVAGPRARDEFRSPEDFPSDGDETLGHLFLTAGGAA
jgi:hypothetical protein